MSRQQIKSSVSGYEFKYIKSLKQIEDSAASVVVELNDLTIQDLKEQIDLVSSQNLKVLCFYPHQQTALAQEAISLGLRNLYVKSKFFSEAAGLISSQLA